MEVEPLQENQDKIMNNNHFDWDGSLQEHHFNQNYGDFPFDFNFGISLYYLLTTVAFSLILTFLLQFFANECIKRNLEPLYETFLSSFFAGVTPAMTLLGIVLLLCVEVSDMDSVILYSPLRHQEITVYSIIRLLEILTHTFFMVRTLFFWTTFLNERFQTYCKLILFVLDVTSIITGYYFVALQYLTVINCYCQENKECLSRLASIFHFDDMTTALASLLLEMCTTIILLAGTLRISEEWYTNREYSSPEEAIPSQMNSIFSYSYWVIVTISSVGFGDMLPVTVLGKLTLTFFLFCRMIWVSEMMAALQEKLEVYQEKCFMNSKTRVSVPCKDRNELRDLDKYLSNACADIMKEISLEVVEFGLDAKEALKATPHYPTYDMIFLIRDKDRTSCESDMKAIDIVRSLRGNRCKAPLIVKMETFQGQEFMKMVIGWNHTSDVCLSLEFLTAHILSLGAHSRLAPSFIRSSVMKQLTFEDCKKAKGKYFEVLEREYFNNNRLVLAVIDETNEIKLLPKMMESTWTRLYLKCESCKGKDESVSHEEFFYPGYRRPKVETSAICSTAFIKGESSNALKQAFCCHNITEVDVDLGTNVIIHNSPHPLKVLEANEKYEKGENRLVSTFDHGFSECYGDQVGCLCGTYETENLLRELMAAAISRRCLYDVWIKLITEDYLHADIIEEDCTYGDVFKHFIGLGKVLLGAEVCYPEQDSVRLPVINPLKDLKLHKEDIVLYLQGPNDHSSSYL